MFTICPECGNDKLKHKVMQKKMYDPHTTRVVVEESIPVVEYHCLDCGWVVLVEDPADLPEEEFRGRKAR